MARDFIYIVFIFILYLFHIYYIILYLFHIYYIILYLFHIYYTILYLFHIYYIIFIFYENVTQISENLSFRVYKISNKNYKSAILTTFGSSLFFVNLCVLFMTILLSF